MEKIIRVQDAKYKVTANQNNETSIFIEKNIAKYLNLKDKEIYSFRIYKKNLIKAVTFTYSLNIKLYNKSKSTNLDENWLKNQLNIIDEHFKDKQYCVYEVSVNVSKNRFYFHSLEQKPSKLNIRNFLVAHHFKIIFNNEEEIQLEYSYTPYVDQTVGHTLYNQNKIYYGSPGTGKSYKINNILKNKKDRTERVTFHPEYDYISFVGGFKPITEKCARSEKEEIKYKFVPQVFTKIYVKAWNDPKNDYYLVIEEINRGNCAEIFGDIFQLLDRNFNCEITPSNELQQYLLQTLSEVNKGIINGKMSLPPNLNILATMNTSDQSLFPMDSAFKRRWDWEYIPINYDRSEENPSSKFQVILSNSELFYWLDFIEKVNAIIKQNYNLGMDKCIGNYFIKAVDNRIRLEEFINKVIFHLWNDVFKDENDSIFEENSFYEDFFPICDYGKAKVKDILKKINVDLITIEDD